MLSYITRAWSCGERCGLVSVSLATLAVRMMSCSTVRVNCETSLLFAFGPKTMLSSAICWILRGHCTFQITLDAGSRSCHTVARPGSPSLLERESNVPIVVRVCSLPFRRFARLGSYAQLDRRLQRELVELLELVACRHSRGRRHAVLSHRRFQSDHDQRSAGGDDGGADVVQRRLHPQRQRADVERRPDLSL